MNRFTDCDTTASEFATERISRSFDVIVVPSKWLRTSTSWFWLSELNEAGDDELDGENLPANKGTDRYESSQVTPRLPRQKNNLGIKSMVEKLGKPEHFRGRQYEIRFNKTTSTEK